MTWCSRSMASAALFAAVCMALLVPYGVCGQTNEVESGPEPHIIRLFIVDYDPAVSDLAASREVIPTRYFMPSESERGKSAPAPANQFHQLYPGIDFATYGDGERMEYVFRLGRGADPSRVRLRIEGVLEVKVDEGGDVVGAFPRGQVLQSRPSVFYECAGVTRELSAQYSMRASGDIVIEPLADFEELWSRAAGVRFNVVPGGGQPEGTAYDFYLSKYEATNEEFVRFLNSAEANENSARGSNMYFDQLGNVWFNSTMTEGKDELFVIGQSKLTYDLLKEEGNRYGHVVDETGNPVHARHPVGGATWYGAVKYCNWLTLDSGRGEAERCYREGADPADWAPVTATNWANGQFSEWERFEWLRYKGFRLPMANPSGSRLAANSYSEFYKAAGWNGTESLSYGFGNEEFDALSANFRSADSDEPGELMPVGSYDGKHFYQGDILKPANNFYGIHDLSGNSDEWMSDPAGPGSLGNMVSAGGSVADSPMSISECRGRGASSADSCVGFRAATTYMPEEFAYIYILFSFYMEPEDLGEGPPGDTTPPGVGAAWWERHGVGTPVIPPEEIVDVEPIRVTFRYLDSVYDEGPDSFDYYVGDEWTQVERLLRREIGTTFDVLVVAPYVVREGLLYKEDPVVTPEPEPPPAVTPLIHGLLYATNTLTIDSSNPNHGVTIIVSPPDVDGQTTGTTRSPFYRKYVIGSRVTLTAPARAGDNTFLRWTRDGQQISGRRTVQIIVAGDTTLVAVYVSPKTLRVRSINPSSGVDIYNVTPDRQWNTDGTTEFSRSYDHGSLVSATAPHVVGTNTFLRWLLNGTGYTTSHTAVVSMFADLALTAEYVPPRSLTVSSINPASGVDITGVTPDRNLAGDGTTIFVRSYDNGTVVSLTAPQFSTTNSFLRWLRDGLPYTTNVAAAFSILADTEFAAEYVPPRTVTFESENPAAGVSITGVTPDRNGNSDGVTLFTRSYDNLASIVMTAPYAAPNGYVFSRWLQDGALLSTNRTASAVIIADTLLTVQYVPPPVLDVTSQDPASGVNISGVTVDNNGNGDGITAFARVYFPGSNVTLTAEYSPTNGYVFSRWLQDGSLLTTNRTASITITVDTMLTAVYVPPPVLTVGSQNPASGVSISGVTLDNNGAGDGQTPFTRVYYPGSNVVLTALYSPTNGYVFSQWLRNGAFLTTNRTASITIVSDTTLIAVYVPPPVVTVASVNPGAGISITNVTSDNNGNGDGVTVFARVYYPGSNMTATAPFLAPAGNYFMHWLRDGAVLTSNMTASIIVMADTTLSAEYRVAPILTVDSLNPGSGVNVSGVSVDNLGNGDGVTPFSRVYFSGSNITLTAEYAATNGYVFSRWLRNGSPLTTNRTAAISISVNTVLTAEYVPPPVLAVRSANPASGVNITGVTLDNKGQGDGVTAFDRVYFPASNVTLTAEYVETNGNVFVQWLQDGTPLTTGRTANISIVVDTTLTAVYRVPPVVTIASINPASGLSVTNVTLDNNGQGDGVTVFSRVYYPGSNMTATVPFFAPNGNYFSRWLQDGSFLTSNRTASITVLNDTTLSAEYTIAPVLNVNSLNPAAGVNISGVSADNLGNGDGVTAFSRVYFNGSNITMSAEYAATNGYVFSRWLRNGLPLTTNRTANIAITADTTMTAEYVAPPVLTVRSQNPASGVNITGVTVDNSGLSDGVTAFARIYFPGSNVTLTAEYVETNGNVFVQWLQDGAPLTTGRTANITIFADTTLTAVYRPPPVITVASINPGSGLSITNVTRDNQGNSDGITIFTRVYFPGSNVTMTAPFIAPDGNYFGRWLQDGSFLTSNRTASIIVADDTALTAEYQVAPVLTVNSINPSAGVNISGVSVDNLGNADGITVFSRVYFSGSNITVTAEYAATNGYVFSQWLRNGLPLTTNRTANTTITADTTLTAQYVAPPVVTFNSLDPNSGVSIAGVTVDNHGDSDGVTTFLRTYFPGSNVTATAPYIAPNGNVFDAWLRDGSLLTTNRTAAITVSADTTLTAAYRIPPVVSFESSNPGSGVGITGVTLDNNGDSDGSTAFTRTYYPGSNVTATAPLVAPGGNVFNGWLQDGVFLTSNFTAAITVISNTTLTARYSTSPILTIRSANPVSGVSITGVSIDNNGNGDGATVLTRVYFPGSNVTATASYLAPAGNVFIYWRKNGVFSTSNQTIAVTMTNDTTITAVYRAPPVVSFTSADPAGGVTITNVTLDINGDGDGGTPFTRQYYPGSNVTAIAPPVAAGNLFLRWLQDGFFLSSNRVLNIVVTEDTSLTSVYTPSPVVTVNSLNPGSGVSISGVTVDSFGNGDGSTVLVRTYFAGSNASFTAAYATTNGNVFLRWLQDGSFLTTNLTATIAVVADTMLTAVYEAPPLVTFESQNPNSGVSITGVTLDNNGQGDGITSFSRTYFPGSNVTATAAYAAPNGYVFDRWLQDGILLTTNRTAAITVSGDTTLSAAYRAPPAVTFASQNPNSGVTITGVTLDNNNNGDGSTTFNRIYFPGSNVTATAPYTAPNGYVFERWFQDGALLTTGRTMVVTITTNTTLTAIFAAPPVLTFDSVNPASGVAITGVTPDIGANGDGVTSFTRTYYPGSNVAAMASYIAPNGNVFLRWLRDGVFLSSNLTINIVIVSNSTLTAEYQNGVVVSFESLTPASGVAISGVSVDNLGSSDGVTMFSRIYVPGSNISATAAYLAPNGNVFEEWRLNGSYLSTNPGITVMASSNSTLTARYRSPPVITFESVNPNSGVGITGVTPDRNNDGDGVTIFTRVYLPGSNVFATAQLLAPNGNIFKRWLMDGVFLSSNRTIMFTVVSNSTLRAEYFSAAVLSVNSQNPNSGVGITGVSVDNTGQGNGATPFIRVYFPGTNITATAPYLAPNGYSFYEWLLDGLPLTTNLTASFILPTNATLTARYVTPPLVTFDSQNPNSGVTISGVTLDNYGAGDGITSFNREYYPGSNITATAPYIAPNGNVFARWLRDGAPLTSNRTAGIVAGTNATTLTADYIAAIQILFESIDPNNGVSLSGVSLDNVGAANGSTPFSRLYVPGSNVTVTAPYLAANGNVFDSWLRDGSYLSTNRTIGVVASTNMTLTAYYRTPPVLSFETVNPNAGVSITGVTSDNNGESDGVAPFTRVYYPYSNVTAAAPVFAPNGNIFEYWLLDGAFLTSNTTMNVMAMSNATLTAQYRSAAVLSVNSLNPSVGVNMTGVSVDNLGQGDGPTPFTRAYYPGSNITVTAPYLSPNLYAFYEWLLDGVPYTTNFTAALVISSNTTLTARYLAPPEVSFESQNPNSGVDIVGVVPDNFGNGNGTTPFMRVYYAGSNVTATAPYIAPNGNVFDSWLRDGAFISSNLSVSTVLGTNNITLTAVYADAATIDFESIDPASGVNLTGVSIDNLLAGDGSTPFSRLYVPGSNVTATAPYLAPNGNVFDSWLRDGSYLTTNLTMNIVADTNMTLTVYYRTPPVLSFETINPASGVGITGVTLDNNGDGDGTAPFNRVYYPYSNVTATAPVLAPDGNIFLHWLFDGIVVTSNTTVNIIIISNATLTAEYRSAAIISFDSENPASGVLLTGVSVDNMAQGDGTTPFTRAYYPGSNISATAPYLAPGGNSFHEWVLDGAPLTTNLTMSTVITSNATLTARYVTPPIVSFESLNPDSGIDIAGVSLDNNGDGDGTTAFVREYYPGSNVTATAPYLALNGNVFGMWRRDGVLLTSNLTAAIVLGTNDTTLTAEYISAAVLSFESLNPATGINLTGVSLDNLGDSDGAAPFTRLYVPGSNVTATAPALAPDGALFLRWLQDGSPLTTNLTAAITIYSNTTLTAEYSGASVISVETLNPNSGISITNVTLDNYGNGDGTAPFSRTYSPGANINMSADFVAWNGNVFTQWEEDGTPISTNRHLSYTVDTNVTLTAVYVASSLKLWLSYNPTNILYDDPIGTAWLTATPMGGNGTYVAYEYEFLLLHHVWNPTWSPSALTNRVNTFDWNYSIKYRARVQDSTTTWSPWSNEAYLYVTDPSVPDPSKTQSGL